MPLGAWGKYISFEVSSDRVLTVDGVTVEGAARWATHEVVGLPPVYEFVGPGLRTCSAKVRAAVPQGVNPRALINTLRKAQNAGATAVLVIGDSPVFDAGSLAVLDSLGEAHTYYDRRANTYIAELDITWHELVPRTAVKAPTTPTAKATVTKKNVVSKKS